MSSEVAEIQKDILGQKYIVFSFEKGDIKPFLNHLRDVLTQEEFVQYTYNQKIRDRGKYHLTIVGSAEFAKAESQGIYFENLPKGKPKLLALGKAGKKNNISYYVIVDYPEGNKFREEHGLPTKDFHITLAFRGADVHDVQKDISTKI